MESIPPEFYSSSHVLCSFYKRPRPGKAGMRDALVKCGKASNRMCAYNLRCSSRLG